MEDFIKINESNEMTVYLSGELDHHGVALIRGEIDERLFFSKPSVLIFELSDVEFMDSSGLGLILGRYARTSALGIPIVIRNPSKRHERLFKMAEMQNIVKIEKGEKYENEKNH